MFNQYKIDNDSKARVWVGNGNFITVKYAGSTNRAFAARAGKIAKLLEVQKKGGVTEAEGNEIMAETLFAAIIVDWGYVDENGVDVLKSFTDGENAIEYDEKKLYDQFMETPLLMQDVFSEASDRSKFVDMPDTQDAAGN